MSETFVVLEADSHRNGIAGESFYVGIIGDGDETRKLIVFFPELDHEGELLPSQPRIAVLNLDTAAEGNIYMHPHHDHPGGNAWRGDHYGDAARAIVDAVNERYS